MNPRRVVAVALSALAVAAVAYFLLQADQRSRAREAATAEVELALEAERDPAKALRLATAALTEHPGDAELELLRGRAFAARGRHSEALEAFEAARPSLEEGDQQQELRFLVARSLVLRYVEAGDRGDLNRAEGDLEALVADPLYGDAARVLLGLALVRRADARDRDRAKTLLREGLASSGVDEWVDVERARAVLDSL